MLYRIFTEDKNRETVVKDIGEHFDSFTLIPATGYWLGQAENSIDIEIETAKESEVYTLANQIKADNQQQAVLVQRIDESSKLV